MFTNHQETAGLQDFVFVYFGLHWVFVAMCGLSLAEASEGFSSVAERGLLIVMASLIVEHKL